MTRNKEGKTTTATAKVDASPTSTTATVSATTKEHTQHGNTFSATTASRTTYFTRHMTPDFPQLDIDPKTIEVVWRDCFFILLGCVAVSIIGFVETHAKDADARFTVNILGVWSTHAMALNPHGIVDTGFILTFPLYEFLKENRDWNDILAALNSVILVLPTMYATYVTVWKGDYSCVFRILAVQLLRAFCGWFTYLPPDPTYLNSVYDFPDFVHCIFEDCHAAGRAEAVVQPFVSFFSGHVATMVVVGNHMALFPSMRYWAVLIHALNVLQVVRLLATRGHYSIDMIIGWYVAVYVSANAGRLGRYYSRGGKVKDMVPKTPQDAFDLVTGVSATRNQKRMSMLMQRPEVQEAFNNMPLEEGEGEESETTARILQETASKMMQEQAEALQEEMKYLREQAGLAVRAMREQKIRESAMSMNGGDIADKVSGVDKKEL